MTEIRQTRASGLAGYAETMLEAFDRFGAVLEGERGEAISRTLERGSLAMAPRDMQEYLRNERAAKQGSAGIAVEGAAQSKGILTVLGTAVSKLGGALEATTGIMGMARQFHRDREAGDTSYSGTMKAMARSVAQVSGGQAIGWMAGSAVAGFTAVSVTPIVVGVAVGLGAQYLIGKALGGE